MAASKPTAKLTARQAAFAAEYLVDLNGTQAAIRAGYSKAGAEVTASKLLRVPKVASYVEAAMKARSERLELKGDDVLRELLRVGMVDIRKAYDDEGHLLPVKDIPDDVARAIAGIKVFDEFEGAGKDRMKVGEVREVKFNDKIRALELLGKHLGLWNEKPPESPAAAPVTVNVNTQVVNADPKRALRVIQLLTAAGALPVGTAVPGADDDAEDDEVRRAGSD